MSPSQGPLSDVNRPALGESRRTAIAALLREAGAVTVAELEQRFGVSPMTARRDLSELERQGIARRTHGGAVLPSIAAHEDSFARRVEVAKEALPRPPSPPRAATKVEPGSERSASRPPSS